MFTASALGICGIAMKTGAFHIGFVCAATALVGVRMANIPADRAMQLLLNMITTLSFKFSNLKRYYCEFIRIFKEN